MDMFRYYLKLSLRNLMANRLFFSLMITTLAVGVGVFLANIAIIKTMTNDPLPNKSDRVFNVSFNIWPNNNPSAKLLPIMRYDDAMHLLKNDIATHSMIHYQSQVYTRAIDSKTLSRVKAKVRATTPGFFPLTDAPFAFGGSWSDDYATQVVLGHRMNQQLFGGGNSVGKVIDVEGKPFEVVGVLKAWQLKPLFYHPGNDQAFEVIDDIFVPIETAINNSWVVQVQSRSAERIDSVSETRGKNHFFIHAFVQLDRPAQKIAMQNYLDDYSILRQQGGEFLRDNDNRLLDVNQWLELNKVVDERMLAFGLATSLFLAVCIFNASSLLLARYHSARFETGLRRALGARVKDIFYQGLVESTVIGICCAILALIFGWIFLKLSLRLFPDLEHISDIDGSLMLTGVAIAMLTSFVSMIYPLLKSCHGSVSTTLK